ncbi:hypothetical protein BGX38DRAFT_915741 [Terfezia claveryi]|nr:hypothetical protein BGX38DRAFT_915741 [Terfezia claveryi]
MHFFSVHLVVSAFAAVATAAAVPAAEAKAEGDPFFHALNVGYASIPYINKREAEPEIEATKPKKRELTNIRPLLTRSKEHMLLQRTYPDTPTTGPNAGKCGATAGYQCTAQMGICCGGHGAANNMCGFDQAYCAGACQKVFGFCTEPGFQIAFDVDDGDVIWDPITDNVFDANLGDGLIYFGYPPVDPETDEVIPWPSTV